MSEWHLIPLTFQYLIAGNIALVLAIYVLAKNRGSMPAKFFASFAIFIALWQFLIFLHRNAPNASLSKLFFEIGTGFASFIYPTLFLMVSYLQDGNKKHLAIVIPNIIFFIYILVYAPFDVFWTDLGWSYAFKMEVPYILFPLTVSYVALNYVWIIKPIRESKVPIVRKKYKFILYGFTVIFFIGVVIYNILLFPFFHNAPPIGGITVIIGLSMITYGILLKEKIREASFWTVHGKLSDKASLFLQKFFNSMYEGGLGQRHLKFERFLKDVGLNESVSFKEGRIVLLKEPAPSQIVKIIDNALSYLERGDVGDEIVPELLKLWNTLYPLIEVDTPSLIKTHEKYIREKNLIHEIANGRFRAIFLPKDFTEKDLDAFSGQIGVTHKELFGNPVLVEFNPSEKYERKIKAYIAEVLANDEKLAIFSRRGSKVLSILPSRYEQIYLYYLSPNLSKKVVISNREVDLPLYDLTHLLGEIRLATNGRYSILIDNLTDLIHSLDFKRAYRFARHVVEFTASSKVPALFLIAETHGEEIKSAFENLFPIIVRIKGNRIFRIK